MSNNQGKVKRVTVPKPAVYINLHEKIRIILASDRKNLIVQTKANPTNPEPVIEGSSDLEEHLEGGWRTKGYYGTRDWSDALRRVCSIGKDLKLSKHAQADLKMLYDAIKEQTDKIDERVDEIIAVTRKITR